LFYTITIFSFSWRINNYIPTKQKLNKYKQHIIALKYADILVILVGHTTFLSDVKYTLYVSLVYSEYNPKTDGGDLEAQPGLRKTTGLKCSKM